MNEQTTTLARDLAGRPRVFRWMRGLELTTPYGGRGIVVEIVSEIDETLIVFFYRSGLLGSVAADPEHVCLDLDSRSTSGCLLALLADVAPRRVEIREHGVFGPAVRLTCCTIVENPGANWFSFGVRERSIGHALARALVALDEEMGE